MDENTDGTLKVEEFDINGKDVPSSALENTFTVYLQEDVKMEQIDIEGK